MRVSVIIPARDEADAITKVLTDIPREKVNEVIVVDNGSKDNTAQVSASLGARVVSEPIAGYGRACLKGLERIDQNTNIVVFLDADYSDYPQDLESLLKPIERGADLVIGSRVKNAEKGSLTPQQIFGNRLACKLIRLFFNVRFTDLGPFRAVRVSALKRLRMEDRTFGWTVEMQAKAAQLKLNIAEVPVRYRSRIGHSKISGTLKGSIKAGYSIIMTIIRIAVFPIKS